MSLIPLAEAKVFLDVIHDADDAKLQMLLDGAEQEALDFMNRKTFSGACPLIVGGEEGPPADPDVMPASVRVGVLFLLQAAYQSDPDAAERLRRAAEVKLFPYRCSMGV
ncbi:head-tail connector protein [Cupriavidus gilardii]|uniref:head-tail connector protein n=1 Tax=Cupriavidus gilardii TaxID=82541 RepID=UPI0021B28876|nr:head-tail connector protein [Cupriavidus gilardii]UXC34784.1 phage gp6-like head-tail connector protein [Cupriavidus gilardii]UXC37348.1 phage gp6-like head-tail connector protein [Cupriavidus gilardii]